MKTTSRSPAPAEAAEAPPPDPKSSVAPMQRAGSGRPFPRPPAASGTQLASDRGYRVQLDLRIRGRAAGGLR